MSVDENAMRARRNRVGSGNRALPPAEEVRHHRYPLSCYIASVTSSGGTAVLVDEAS